MIGNSLAEMADSLTRTNSNIEFSSDEIPVFNYSIDSSRAIRWLRLKENSNQDIFNIEKVIKELGIRVHYEEMDDDNEFSGYIERRHKTWHIGINKYEIIGRQRFTLAHELAHLLFHRNYINNKINGDRFYESIKLYRSNDNSKHYEMEANSFAAELLMPSSRFREIWKTSQKLEDVSNTFNVSRYAAEFRAKKLNLVPKSH